MNLSDLQAPPFSETRAFLAVSSTWFLSQFLKTIRPKQSKPAGYKWIFDTGGMPSSHSATVSCLAAVTGMYYGVHSLIFLIVLVFAFIIMFDAAGVRRNMGRQAKVLNQILEDFNQKKPIQEAKLKELLGHTPIEVFVGAFLGILMAYLFCGL
ncbi:MAG: divergent PAP2 family protein [Candidatus Omnitrophica bacterium]|nr:divergent PAP2 family protein [Candidatus Omnitrophota bacterium]